MLGLEASPEAIATLRAKFALDQPLPVRFLAWFGNLLQGDLGRSIQTGRPVLEMVVTALGPTLLLAGERDPLAPPRTMQRMADAMPDAKLVTLPAAGHLAHLEYPKEFAAAVHGFLA
jgi:pimeloyl-ACP methyl ester carboxylesterase